MKFLQEVESDRIIRFVLTTCVLLIVFSFILPFPLVLFVQDLLYFSYDHLLFIRPRAAFSGMTYGILLIALTLLSFLVTKILAEKAAKSYRWTLPHLIALLCGLALCVLSVNHYYFLEEGRVGERAFFSFTERDLSFDEVEQVSREVARDNYEVLSYSFDSGELSITIPYDSRDPDASRAIYYLMEKYQWKVRDEFVD